MENKNLVMVIDLEELEGVYEDRGEEKIFEKLLETISKDNRFILDIQPIKVYSMRSNLQVLKDIIGFDFKNNIETYDNYTTYFFCSQDFGIKGMDIFSFHYDKVGNHLSTYNNEEKNQLDIFNGIKELGICKFTEKLYKQATRELIKLKLDEVKEYANGNIAIELF